MLYSVLASTDRFARPCHAVYGLRCPTLDPEMRGNDEATGTKWHKTPIRLLQYRVVRNAC